MVFAQETGTPHETQLTISEKLEAMDDENSPRGVLDSDNSGSSSSSSLSSSSADKSSPLQRFLPREINSHGLQWKNMIDAFKKKSVRRFSTIPLIASSYDISRRGLRTKFSRIKSAEDGIDCGGFPVPKPSWRNFGHDELAAATDNFNPENMLGKGGHAEVYKGCLSDGQMVAVKRLVRNDNEEDERTGDFLSELGIIAHINHPNAAKLLGFGVDGGLHLVLEFSPHGSLATALFGSTESLEWDIRFKIAIGVAEGLRYLHHGCHRRIIHRDIKASNILLSEDYEAQISDFGLAKWLPDQWKHHVVFPIEGTFGYLAPEYFMHGIVNEKTDVFAFGVLLLEIITGRRAVDSCRQSLVLWAKPLLDSNNVKEIADPRLGDRYDSEEMRHAMQTASACINHSSNMRPNMNRVVQLLGGEDGPFDLKPKSAGERDGVLDIGEFDDYNSSRYLDDLTRHMQLVLE